MIKQRLHNRWVAILTLAALIIGVQTQIQPVFAAEIPTNTTRLDRFAGRGSTVVGPTLAAEVIQIPHGQIAYTTNVTPVQPPDGMNMIGIRWYGTLPAGTDVQFHIQVNGHSYTLGTTLDVKTAPTNGYMTEPLVLDDVGPLTVSIELQRQTIMADSPVIDALEITTLAVAGDDPSPRFMATTDQDTPVKILSRSEIGYDESLGLDSNGDPIWPQKRVSVEQIIVHHTAGGTGSGNGAAVARALYYWHTQVLGWGDIGYNFLIDADGNIYKGRKGGLGTIAGHAYNSTTNTDLNPHSVGIALMGCYEHDPSDCPSQDSMTPAMEQALEQLVGWIADEANIDVTTVHDFNGTTAERLSDHRTFDATLCPGDSVDQSLADIRGAAMDFARSIAVKPWQADFVSAQVDAVAIDTLVGVTAKKAHVITLTYQNSGTKTWSGGDVRLKLYRKDGQKATRLRKVSWPDSYGKFSTNEDLVAPGDSATFTVPVKASKKVATVTLVHKLVHAKKTVHKSRSATNLPYQYNYSAAVTSNDLPLGVYADDTVAGTVTWQNTGIKPWDATTAVIVNGEKIQNIGSSVDPGSSLTLRIPIPTTPLGPALPEDRTMVIALRQHRHVILGTRLVRSYGIHQLGGSSL